jgi:hypothetical protein
MEPAPTRAVTLAEPGRARPLAEALRALADSVPGVFALCLAGAVAIRYEGLFPSVIDWDESLYAVIAQHWLQGELPYQAVWDQHSVGVPALFAAILYLFPKSILALRLSACVAVAVTVTAIYFIAHRFDRRPLSGIVAAILYLFWTARWWGLAANTEIYLNALIAPAMLILFRGRDAGPRQQSVASACAGGFLLGLALQAKQVALAETAFFFMVLLWDTPFRWRWPAWRVFGAAAAAFALPTLVVIGYFWFEGLLDTYIHAVVTANLLYIADPTDLTEVWQKLPRSVSFPIFTAAAAGFLLIRRPERRPVLVLLWAIASAIDVIAPRHFWPHYFLLIMPPGAVLGGYLAARAAERRPKLAVLAFPAALLVANPMGVVWDAQQAHAFAHRDVPRIVARFIDERLGSGSCVFVFNYQPVIYLLTKARLPTRHAFPDDWSMRFVQMSGVVPVEDLARVFQTEPEFVVVLNKDWNHVGAAAIAELNARLAASYQKQFTIEDRQTTPKPALVEVYQRKSKAALFSGAE